MFCPLTKNYNKSLKNTSLLDPLLDPNPTEMLIFVRLKDMGYDNNQIISTRK